MDKKIGILIGLALLLLVPFLGTVHLFDWDEINFAECAREMVASGNFNTVTIDFEPFWEKPPLFIWMQAASMKVFGVNEFAARFPNVLAGVFTILSLWFHGKRQHSEGFGLWWAALYLGSFLPNMYFHSGIIDPWFNLFIFNALAFYFMALKSKTSRLFVVSGIVAGLAVMTKGPVAFLLIGAPIFIFHLANRFKNFPSFKPIFFSIFSALAVGGIWFLLLAVTGNKDVIVSFIDYQIRLFNTQDAGHGGPFYYHFLVLALGCFPASFLVFASFRKSNMAAPSFKLLMTILGCFTLLLFSIVQTKIIHYSSLCYFPLTYLAADFWANGLEKSKSKALIANGILMLVVGLVLAGLTYIQLYTPGIEHLITINDEFAKANLSANEAWHLIDFLPALVFVGSAIVAFLVIRKYGPNVALACLLAGVALGILTLQATILPHIEGYSQSAAIEFYKKHQKEHVYLIPLGFKSYAHLFYGQIKPPLHPNRVQEQWICSKNTDLACYYVAKIQDKNHYLDAYPNLQLLYEKNGFVFFGQRENVKLKW